MKFGSYEVLEFLGDFAIGYNNKSLQPYVTWERTPTDVINAVFHATQEEALEDVERRKTANEK